MQNNVHVFSLQKKFQRHAHKAAQAATACLFVLGKKDAEVDVYLIDEKKMRELNKKFRRHDTSTNVLSFEEPKGFPCPERHAKRGGVKLGEIYLAPDYIERKEENIGHLVIHGILHLLGYTHEGVRDRIEMEKKETYVQSFNLPGYRLGKYKRGGNGERKRRSCNVHLGV
ncbi:MAG: rRNA maturation RNase YbeY [bacterium]|nr:rRNA maturation RNase YbeY [bacterium]